MLTINTKNQIEHERLQGMSWEKKFSNTSKQAQRNSKKDEGIF